MNITLVHQEEDFEGRTLNKIQNRNNRRVGAGQHAQQTGRRMIGSRTTRVTPSGVRAARESRNEEDRPPVKMNHNAYNNGHTSDRRRPDDNGYETPEPKEKTEKYEKHILSKTKVFVHPRPDTSADEQVCQIIVFFIFAILKFVKYNILGVLHFISDRSKGLHQGNA